MTSSPSALVAVLGFSSFHFRFAPSDKHTFCHSSLVTLYPAPLSPLDDNVSIAWSVRALVQYIKTNTWPSKLQSSLLGYFPGLYETATGDTDAPSRHSCAAHTQLLLLFRPSLGVTILLFPYLHHLVTSSHLVSSSPHHLITPSTIHSIVLILVLTLVLSSSSSHPLLVLILSSPCPRLILSLSSSRPLLVLTSFSPSRFL